MLETNLHFEVSSVTQLGSSGGVGDLCQLYVVYICVVVVTMNK